MAAAAKAAPYFLDPPADPRDDAAERDERRRRHLAVLAELAEIGMDLARLVRDAAAGTGGEEAQAVVQRLGGGDPALAFSRISRAVRQTLMLEDRVAKTADERDAIDVTAGRGRREAAAEQHELAQANYRDEQNARIYNALDRAVRESYDPEKAEEYLDAIDDLTEHPHEMAELLRYSGAEIVLRICRRLGIVLDWNRWGDESWAAEILAARIAPHPDAANSGREADDPPGELPDALMESVARAHPGFASSRGPPRAA